MGNHIEEHRYFERDDAQEIAAKLAEVGVYTTTEATHRGWTITPNAHTDIVDLAKVLDTFKVTGKVRGQLGSEEADAPVHALYKPYGGDGWPGIAIYWGSKP